MQLNQRSRRAVDSEEDSDELERDIANEDEDRLTEKHYTAGSQQQSSELQETVEKTNVHRPETVRPTQYHRIPDRGELNDSESVITMRPHEA